MLLKDECGRAEATSLGRFKQNLPREVKEHVYAGHLQSALQAAKRPTEVGLTVSSFSF
ncbi:hypothetical protein TUSST3_65880 [Streptomyces sp. TUS-ST3]|nr:hypothetical protein TUSST3_65880 [Streptomyces sp. TUS-ST3]